MKDHPYDALYLSQVVETQGRFFENLQDEMPRIDSEKMMEAYLRSDLRRQLDEGHAFYLTLSDGQLKRRFLASGYVPEPGEPIQGFMPNWIGRFYAYAQWDLNVPSACLVERLSVADLTSRYPGVHDLDLRLAVDKLCRGLKTFSAILLTGVAALTVRADEIRLAENGRARAEIVIADEAVNAARA